MTLMNETAIATLGRKIRTARVIADLKQDDIARAAGVSRSAVSQWENGETEPSASKLFAIAARTNQPLGWFAEGLVNGETPAASATGVSILSQHSARPEGLEPPTFWLGDIDPFWTVERSLNLASLWCQAETDTKSTNVRTVA